MQNLKPSSRKQAEHAVRMDKITMYVDNCTIENLAASNISIIVLLKIWEASNTGKL